MSDEKRIRCGDSVLYKFPDGRDETWLVAYADYETNRLAWSGWPEGCVDLDKCELVRSCTDEEHEKHVAEWLDKPHSRNEYGGSDHRIHFIRKLYRPLEHRDLIRKDRRERIQKLEIELAQLHSEDENDG